MVDETHGSGQGCCGDARPEEKADGFCCGADITSEMGPHIELARAFKALAHPARLMILSKLGSHQHCCGDICSSLPLAQSTVSQHLKVLRECGFIEWETAGQQSHYRVNSNKVSWFLSQSAAFFAEERIDISD